VKRHALPLPYTSPPQFPYTTLRSEEKPVFISGVAHCVVTLHRALFSCHRTPSIPLSPFFVKSFFSQNQRSRGMNSFYGHDRTRAGTTFLCNVLSTNYLRVLDYPAGSLVRGRATDRSPRIPLGAKRLPHASGLTRVGSSLYTRRTIVHRRHSDALDTADAVAATSIIAGSFGFELERRGCDAAGIGRGAHVGEIRDGWEEYCRIPEESCVIVHRFLRRSPY
jgi:hypothetical protein